MEKQIVDDLVIKAKEIRKETVEMIGKCGMGHIGGCLSIAEVLSVLYFKILNIDPKNPQKNDRDRFILSKGHAGPALYAALAIKGYFDKKELDTLNKPNTYLPSHCDMNRTVGVDMTAGSLGQGLSVGVGMAVAAKLDHNPCKIYVLIGDGESQEGQIWEAAMFAGHMKLKNIITFLDNNELQIDGKVSDINDIEPLEDKWRAFGWHVQKVDGHDVCQIIDAINVAKNNQKRPSIIILKTVKGKGIDFVEGNMGCHHMNITEEQWKKAVDDLGGNYEQ